MTDRERALDRARKLNALARDQSDSPEGQTAAKLFANLCERWGFSAEELAPPDQDEIQVYRIYVEFGEPRIRARADLLSVLGHIADVLVTYRMDPPAADGSPGLWMARLFGESEQKLKAVAAAFADVESWLDRRLRNSNHWRTLEQHGAAERLNESVRRSWWKTAAAVLLRMFRERQAQQPAASSAGSTDAAAPAGSAEPANALPGPTVSFADMLQGSVAELPPTVASQSSVAVRQQRVKEAHEKIASGAVHAPPEEWSWIEEAAQAIRDKGWPFEAESTPVPTEALVPEGQKPKGRKTKAKPKGSKTKAPKRAKASSAS